MAKRWVTAHLWTVSSSAAFPLLSGSFGEVRGGWEAGQAERGRVAFSTLCIWAGVSLSTNSLSLNGTLALEWDSYLPAGQVMISSSSDVLKASWACRILTFGWTDLLESEETDTLRPQAHVAQQAWLRLQLGLGENVPYEREAGEAEGLPFDPNNIN